MINVNVLLMRVAVVAAVAEDNMRNITYLHYNRVYTPKNSSSASQLQAGDINQDGVVDILDLSEIAAFDLQDFNNDGIIDILDAAEYLANPGGIAIVEPPPPPPPPEPKFDVEKCCDEHYPEGHWAFYTTFGKFYERRCRDAKDPVTKISYCLPCNSTPVEEATCKACATVPDFNKTDGQYGSRLVEIYVSGTEPTNPAVKLGKGKATVEQDGVEYSIWCSSIILRKCIQCSLDPDTGCCSISSGGCECRHGPFGDPSWYAIGTSYCTGFTQEECVYYWFRQDYPYPVLQSPEQVGGPYVGTFIWDPGNAGHTDMCKCADLTQDYDPCRYGATVMECIGDDRIDPNTPSAPE